MIYTITQRYTESGEDKQISIERQFRIKVPGRSAKDDPYLGFASIDIGEAFMKFKNMSLKEFQVVPILDVLDEEQRQNPVLVYENEKQIMEAENDTEGYDYESLIRHHAL